jgi:hypothetical protein
MLNTVNFMNNDGSIYGQYLLSIADSLTLHHNQGPVKL